MKTKMQQSYDHRIDYYEEARGAGVPEDGMQRQEVWTEGCVQ